MEEIRRISRFSAPNCSYRSPRRGWIRHTAGVMKTPLLSLPSRRKCLGIKNPHVGKPVVAPYVGGNTFCQRHVLIDPRHVVVPRTGEILRCGGQCFNQSRRHSLRGGNTYVVGPCSVHPSLPFPALGDTSEALKGVVTDCRSPRGGNTTYTLRGAWVYRLSLPAWGEYSTTGIYQKVTLPQSVPHHPSS